MKLIIQIAFGVFLGSVAAQITADKWRQFEEKKEKELVQQRLSELKKSRLEQADRIRAMFLKNKKEKLENSGALQRFVPDDAQMTPSQDE